MGTKDAGDRIDPNDFLYNVTRLWDHRWGGEWIAMFVVTFLVRG
jgi:hypothetical protein